jgi:16S rRNA (cytosine1402-N4)-methyltransferase
MRTGRDTKADGVVGGPARHVPVLLEEVLTFLAPGAGGTFIDGTFGAGGYSRAILATGASVVALDRDGEAVDAGAPLKREAGKRLTLVEGRFSDLDRIARAHGH